MTMGIYQDRVPDNFRESEKSRVAEMSNRKLYEEAFDLAGGDDYDGDFTRKGEITFDVLTKELDHRLKNWLDS